MQKSESNEEDQPDPDAKKARTEFLGDAPDVSDSEQNAPTSLAMGPPPTPLRRRMRRPEIVGAAPPVSKAT